MKYSPFDLIKSYAFRIMVLAVPATSISNTANIRICLFTIAIYMKVFFEILGQGPL